MNGTRSIKNPAPIKIANTSESSPRYCNRLGAAINNIIKKMLERKHTMPKTKMLSKIVLFVIFDVTFMIIVFKFKLRISEGFSLKAF